jgi:hypothetical protein
MPTLNINNDLVLFPSANVGIKGTPSDWASGYTALNVGAAATISWTGAGANDFSFSTNAYYDASDNRWEYRGTGDGSARYSMTALSFEHQWFNAPIGTANAAISYTQAMTLKGNGNLLIGTTTDNGDKLQVAGQTTINGSLYLRGGSRSIVGDGGDLLIDTESVSGRDLLLQTQSGQKVGIGTTSPGAKFQVVNNSTGNSTISICNETNGGDGLIFQTWQYVEQTTNFRLDLKQRVTSGVVQYAFDIVNGGTSYNNNLVLDRGNVGIGTNDPTRSLQVVGTTRHERVYAYANNLFQFANDVPQNELWLHLGTQASFTTDKIYYRVNTQTSEEEGEIIVKNTCVTANIEWFRNSYNVMVTAVKARMQGGCGNCEIFIRVRYGSNYGGANTIVQWQVYNGTDSGFTTVNAVATPGTGTNEANIESTDGYMVSTSNNQSVGGSLGVGTTSPSVHSGSNALVIKGNSGAGAGRAIMELHESGGTGGKAVFQQVGSTTYIGNLAGSGSLVLLSNGQGSSATEAVYVLANGNILIGTSTDSGYKLRVNGSSYFDAPILCYTGNGYITALTNDGVGSTFGFGYSFLINNTGHEIGRIAGQYQDSASGGTGGIGIYTRQAGTLNQRLIVSGNGTVQVNNNASSGVASTNFIAYAYDSDSFFKLGNNTNNSLDIQLTRSDTATMFTVNGHTGLAYFAGNVLIGTATDSGYKLDVSGIGRFQGAAGTSPGVTINNASTSGTTEKYVDFTAGATTIGSIFRGNGASGVVANGLNIDNYDGFQVRANQLGGSGGTINFLGGNVGIGTTSPSSILHLEKSSTSNDITGTPSIIISNRNSTSGTFIGGGIFNNPYRDVSSSSVTAGVWFENANSPDAGAAAKSSAVVFGANSYSANWNTPTERMRITQAGSVGISTNNPQARLDVVGNSAEFASGVIQATPAYSGGSYFSAFRAVPSDVADRISYAGLFIGSISSDNALISSGGVYNSAGQFYPGRTTYSGINLSGGEIGFQSNTGLTGGVSFAPTTRMILKNTGNLLIGTTTDNGYKLDVAGTFRASTSGSVARIETSTNATEVLQIYNSGGNSGSVQGVTHLGINFFSVGTNSPVRITAFQESNSGYRGGMYFSTRNANSDSAPSEAMRISPDQLVGIGTSGTTAADYRLTVDSTGVDYAIYSFGSTHVDNGALGVGVVPSATTGRIDASNDIVAYSSSDKRLKENITPIANALDKVKALTGVEFDWKPEHKEAHGYEGHDTGVIAQEVKEVMPSAVRENETGFLAVRYEKLIGLLIEAVKEQQAEIDELKKLIK